MTVGMVVQIKARSKMSEIFVDIALFTLPPAVVYTVGWLGQSSSIGSV